MLRYLPAASGVLEWVFASVGSFDLPADEMPERAGNCFVIPREYRLRALPVASATGSLPFNLLAE